MLSKYAGGHHHKINFRDETEFKERWGITAADLARVEEVTPDAIHMRVMLYGTPFQRRNRFTTWEKRFGKPLGQLALDRGIHPQTLTTRYKIRGELDLPEKTKPRMDRRDLSWIADPKYSRALKSTTFTLEWALAQLEALNAE